MRNVQQHFHQLVKAISFFSILLKTTAYHSKMRLFSRNIFKPTKSRFLFLITLVVLGYTIFTTKLKKLIWIEVPDFYQINPNTEFLPKVIEDEFFQCLNDFSKYFSPVTNLTKSEYDWQNSSSRNIVPRRYYPIFDVIEKWNKIILSLNLESMIIEPSILLCVLPKEHRRLLMIRNFNIRDYLGPQTVITFGIFSKAVSKLKEDSSLALFDEEGFKQLSVKESSASWMHGHNLSRETIFTSHIFYKYQEWCVHVVVFYERNNYLWHASLSVQEEGDIVPALSDLLFVENNSAYEKFTAIPIIFKKGFLSNFSAPSMPHYFLFQIQSSVFLECDRSRGDKYFNATGYPMKHPSLTVENFNLRAIIALNHLKALFNPLLMNFWMWSGTMLGWYRQCDIIPYTTDVDFGAWATEVDNLDYLVKELSKNTILTIKERMGLAEKALEFNLNCKGLRVDVFFLYQELNGTWYSGHAPRWGYFFKYYHPNFTLCSAELLGQKVQVPCETEEVIVQEYGPKWREPVSSWDYERSIKNRGPNIYWEKAIVKKVYESF